MDRQYDDEKPAFREVRLADVWQATRSGEPVPKSVYSLRSWECVLDGQVVGHCTGDSATGEIVGLSVLPPFRKRDIGKRLLALLVDALRTSGAKKVWLAAPADPAAGAHGFYRAVGWLPTGEKSSDGSEILEPPTP